MNILFLSLGKIERLNTRGIYQDLLRKFSEEGHNLYIMSPRERKFGLPTTLETHNGVNFLKIRIGNIQKVNIFEKGISTLTIEGIFLNALKKYYSNIRFDLVLYATPPITFTNVVKYVQQRDGAKTYLLLKDIFPQNAVDIDMLKSNGLLTKYFRRKEKQLYNISDYIGCMSPANKKYILEKNPEIAQKKVEINPNTIDPQNIYISKEQKEDIRKKYNLPINKSVFIYGGNLGKPQGIDFLIECIRKNEQNIDSYFLIVGSGTQYSKLDNYFKKYQPNNAKLLEHLPKEDYELLVNTCDVGLIFLDNRFTIPNFPSRLLSYMQASMPVLAATDPNTDIGEVIEEGQFGYSCISDNVEKFNKLVIKLSNKNLQSTLGRNARKYLENNYTSEHSYEIIMNHFKDDL